MLLFTMHVYDCKNKVKILCSNESWEGHITGLTKQKKTLSKDLLFCEA